MPSPKSKVTKPSPSKPTKVKGRVGGKGGGEDAKAGGSGKARRKAAGPKGQSQSCHQCRQSIHSSKGVSEVKCGKERTKCGHCTRYWCQQCLQNRYGIARSSLDPASWSCPVCSGNCNCSLCRKKEGKLATGILTPLVKTAGYESVSDFLAKGTDDIAKCLQWTAPEGATSPATRRPASTSSSSPLRSPSRSRKRKRTHSNQENSTSVANTSPPPHSSPLTPSRTPTTTTVPSSPPEASQGSDQTTPCAPRLSAKRRRLSHSRYNITMEDEEDPLINGEMRAQRAKDLQQGTSSPRQTGNTGTPEPENLDIQVGGNCPGDQELSPGDQELNPGDLGLSPGNQELNPGDREWNIGGQEWNPGDFLRRSPRKRKKTTKYSALSPAEHSPGRSRRERKVSPKKGGHVGVRKEVTELLEDRKKELESLRLAKMDNLRLKKTEEQVKRTEERQQVREARKEQRERENEEKRLQRQSRESARNKLRLAQSILKEAQKEKVRRQREREKVTKQKLLESLKEKRKEDKRRLQELVSLPLTASLSGGSSVEVDVLSPMTDLPPLPELVMGVAEDTIPRLLFVAEFLYSFADPLKLKRQISAGDLCVLLSSGRGLSEVYLALLRAVVAGDDRIRKDLKPTKRQRELETMAMEYLHQEGRNGFVSGNGGSIGLPVEKSLLILEHLCLEALESDPIREYMEEERERGEEVRRQGRSQEREKTKTIGAGLKEMCDSGCSLEEIEGRRNAVVRELAELRAASEREQYQCGLAIRNQFLGTDRLGRLYWRLQSVAGLVVEVSGRDGHGMVVEDGTEHRWFTISSEDLLKKLTVSLVPSERPLHHSLSVHLTDILSSLKTAKRDTAMKKFYGRS